MGVLTINRNGKIAFAFVSLMLGWLLFILIIIGGIISTHKRFWAESSIVYENLIFCLAWPSLLWCVGYYVFEWEKEKKEREFQVFAKNALIDKLKNELELLNQELNAQLNQTRKNPLG